MGNTISCPGCGLSHERRLDSVCPHCGALIALPVVASRPRRERFADLLAIRIAGGLYATNAALLLMSMSSASPEQRHRFTAAALAQCIVALALLTPTKLSRGTATWIALVVVGIVGGRVVLGLLSALMGVPIGFAFTDLRTALSSVAFAAAMGLLLLGRAGGPRIALALAFVAVHAAMRFARALP